MTDVIASKRVGYLETARGIASVIVVFHHFLLGFFPLLKAPVTEGGLKNTPFYLLVNGNGAVAFFFVLSGFVLTHKFYQQFSMPDFTASVLKRLPRLLLPAGLSMMIGASILIYFPEAHEAAARLTGSDWLANFASARFSEGFVPSFTSAVGDSILVFLWPQHAQYNSNLWTMVYEFYGSVIVFALAAASSVFLHLGKYRVIALHVFTAVLCVGLHMMNFLPFIIGSLIAFSHCRSPRLFVFRRHVVVVFVLIMIAGYSMDFRPALILASAATMILLLSVPLLERRLSGPIGLFLGRLSFPLYLVHTLVILSATSAAYTVFYRYGLPRWEVVMLSLALTWILSLLVAMPFMMLERFWVPALNRWSRMGVQRFLRVPTARLRTH